MKTSETKNSQSRNGNEPKIGEKYKIVETVNGHNGTLYFGDVVTLVASHYWERQTMWVVKDVFDKTHMVNPEHVVPL
jgi:hypothetical protein